MQSSTRSTHTTIADLRAYLDTLPDWAAVEVRYPEGSWEDAGLTAADPELSYATGILTIDIAAEA